jgi:hypothetical protein
MRDDNMEPRDSQQIADDNQQSGLADRQDVDDQITNSGTEDELDDDDDDDEDDDEFSEDEDEASAD